MKWNKDTFMNDMREKCSREIAKIGNSTRYLSSLGENLSYEME